MISVTDISYSKGNTEILSNISFNLNEFDKLALIGKNGAGKTTLFEIILDDLKPTSGKVIFDPEISRKFRKTGVVYDHPPLFPLLKVKELVDYFSTIYNIASHNIPAKYLDVFGIKELENALIKTLSQGEKKKIGLFLSIIHNPKLLILDEPFANIDPTSIESIWNVLQENDRSILFTTHNWKEVRDVANKVAFIYKGRLIMEPTCVDDVLKSLPERLKITTDYNIDIINAISSENYYFTDDTIHIFYNENAEVMQAINKVTNNFSVKECDIKDAYLFKIKDYE